jgi:hypothetical protein
LPARQSEKRAVNPLGPDDLRETLQRRVLDAESRLQRTHVIVDWQRRLIEDMSAVGRGDVGLAREVLSLLYESLHWSEAQIKQVKADLDLLNRRSH